MKTIKERPPINKICDRCSSEYLLEHGDLKAAIVDDDRDDPAWRFRDKHGTWPKAIIVSHSCPACGAEHQDRYWDNPVPAEWADAAIKRSGCTWGQVKTLNDEIVANGSPRKPHSKLPAQQKQKKPWWKIW